MTMDTVNDGPARKQVGLAGTLLGEGGRGGDMSQTSDVASDRLLVEDLHQALVVRTCLE